MKLVDGQVTRAGLWTSWFSWILARTVMFACVGLILVKTTLAFGFGLEPISGTVDLSDSKTVIASTAAIFVMAYAKNDGSGMPVAVVRIAHPTFPLSFKLGAENLMTAETLFPAHVFLKAKLTQRGDAVSKPGDLLSTKGVAAKPGSTNVKLVLPGLGK